MFQVEGKHLQPESKTSTAGCFKFPGRKLLFIFSGTNEAFPNPRQSGALGNAGFRDREWANAQTEKEKTLFPFFLKLCSLNQADNELNFI